MSPSVKYTQQHQSQCSYASEADAESCQNFLGGGEIRSETAAMAKEALENECEGDEEGGQGGAGDEEWF